MHNLRELAAKFSGAAMAAEAEAARAEETDQRVSMATAVMYGLQTQAHIYGGTVPIEVVAKRRAKNRAARRARRVNRLAAKR